MPRPAQHGIEGEVDAAEKGERIHGAPAGEQPPEPALERRTVEAQMVATVFAHTGKAFGNADGKIGWIVVARHVFTDPGVEKHRVPLAEAGRHHPRVRVADRLPVVPGEEVFEVDPRQGAHLGMAVDQAVEKTGAAAAEVEQHRPALRRRDAVRIAGDRHRRWIAGRHAPGRRPPLRRRMLRIEVRQPQDEQVRQQTARGEFAEPPNPPRRCFRRASLPMQSGLKQHEKNPVQTVHIRIEGCGPPQGLGRTVQVSPVKPGQPQRPPPPGVLGMDGDQRLQGGLRLLEATQTLQGQGEIGARRNGARIAGHGPAESIGGRLRLPRVQQHGAARAKSPSR